MRRFRFLAWGLGTQSTYLGILSAIGELEPLDAIIHSDTQWERKGSLEIKAFYTDWFRKKHIPVIETTAGSVIKEGAEAHIHIPFFTSTGGPLRRQCTRHFKLTPGKKAMRKFAGFDETKTPHPKPGQFENWLGFSWDEYYRINDSRIKFIVH